MHDVDQIQRALSAYDPARSLVRTWTLQGGISAQMSAFETDNGQKLVLRQLSDWRYKDNPKAAEEELILLKSVKEAGIPVPTPHFVDFSNQILETPYLLLEYIEGHPELAPKNLDQYLRKYADQLVRIHRLDYRTLGLNFLRTQERGYLPTPEKLNDDLRESEIRQALDSVPVKTASNPPVLRHGDFWPGNVLWKDEEIAAVIDWEEARIGEPLADLAVCRLDVLWAFGQAAMDTFTQRYLSQIELDLTDLWYWDLCCALRPISNMHEWAPSFPQLGREDVTLKTMQRDHRWYVDQALPH